MPTSMKAPRIVLPLGPTPLTPRGISPRTLAYICEPDPAVGVTETESPVEAPLGSGHSLGSCASSLDLTIRSSCSPSSDGLSSSSASPSETSLSSSKSLSSDKSLPAEYKAPDSGEFPDSGAGASPLRDATSPRVPRFSSFSRLRLSSRNTSDGGIDRIAYAGTGRKSLVKLPGARSVPSSFLDEDCCLRMPDPESPAVVSEHEGFISLDDAAFPCSTPRGIGTASTFSGVALRRRNPTHENSARIGSRMTLEPASGNANPSLPGEVDEPCAGTCPTPRTGGVASAFSRKSRRAPCSEGNIRLDSESAKATPLVLGVTCSRMDSESTLTVHQSHATCIKATPLVLGVSCSRVDSESTKSLGDFRSLSSASTKSYASSCSLSTDPGLEGGEVDEGKPIVTFNSSRSHGARGCQGKEQLKIITSKSVDIGEFLGSRNKIGRPDAVDLTRILDENAIGKGRSLEAGLPTSPRMPRFPSLSRLRLASREPEGLASGLPPIPTMCKLPPQLITCVGGAANASPTRSRRLPSSSSLKRKRPPMLDIPMKDAFTASPLSTPELSSEEGVEDVREIVDEGRGFAVMCKRGRRRAIMEDRYQAIHGPGGEENLSYFGIFDGHGGTAAAEFAAEQLHLSLLESLRKRTLADAESAVVDAFVDTDKRFLAKNLNSGASCVACLVTPSELVIGHAGDCRAVMRRNGETLSLTRDHKAAREDERQRIEELGGHVDDFTGTWRVQGIMAVTRGIGDQHLKEYITPTPETCTVATTCSEDFVILGSDGLWDVVMNEEAVAIASAVLFPSRTSSLTESEKLALQLQALLSPKLEGTQSPSVPLTKKGFRSSSLSGTATSASAQQVTCQNVDDGATSKRQLSPGRGNSSSLRLTERLSKASQKLVDLAISRGSCDDVSVLILVPAAVRLGKLQ